MGLALVERAVPSGPVGAETTAGARPDQTGSKACILGAASRCVARFGLSKTTLEDVAREAGLSRATLYRLFPGGREEVVQTMVEREIADYFATLAARLADEEDLGDRLVVVMTSAAGLLAAHRALGFVLAHEPELVLPQVSFSELTRVLDVAASFLAPYLADVLEPEDARRAGEWIARLVLSHVICPSNCIESAWEGRRTSPLDSVRAVLALAPEPLSAERARFLVDTFVLPGVLGLTARRRPTAPDPMPPAPSAVRP